MSTIAPAHRDPSPAAQAVPLEPGADKKRMLIIVNPYATTVSDRLKNLVVYALQARYDVEAVDTEAAEHAIEIGREARHGEYDIVVAFGGDGTLNEVANGLAGTDVPVSVLPGGSTNVVCRTLGIPNDVVDATEHLIGLADDFRPRRIDLGPLQRPPLRLRLRRRARRDRRRSGSTPTPGSRPARGSGTTPGRRSPVSTATTCATRCGSSSRSAARGIEGVTAIAQNSDPFTYFAKVPIRVCEDIGLDDGTLSMALLQRAKQRDMLPIATRVLSQRLRASKHRQIEDFDDVGEALVRSISMDDGRTAPALPGPGRRRLHRRAHRAHIRGGPGRLDDRFVAICASR